MPTLNLIVKIILHAVDREHKSIIPLYVAAPKCTTTTAPVTTPDNQGRVMHMQLMFYHR